MIRDRVINGMAARALYWHKPVLTEHFSTKLKLRQAPVVSLDIKRTAQRLEHEVNQALVGVVTEESDAARTAVSDTANRPVLDWAYAQVRREKDLYESLPPGARLRRLEVHREVYLRLEKAYHGNGFWKVPPLEADQLL